MAESLFAIADLGQARVTRQQVAGDDGHLDHGLPVEVLLLTAALGLGLVPVHVFGAVGLGPGERPRVLSLVVDALVHAPGQFAHVDRLDAHPEIALEESVVDNRAGDAHRRTADAQVRLAAHDCHAETRSGEAKQLLLHVRRDRGVGRILDVAAVDAERRQALLRMGREDRREVHRARSLRAVETPDRLGSERIHVHRLGPIAPARGHRDGDADAFAPEELSRLRRLGDAADAVRSDDALYGRTVRITQFGTQQRCRRLRHCHRLVFERLANPSPPPVDGRPDADLRPAAQEARPAAVCLACRIPIDG